VDLLLIARKLWHYKLATLPVVVLTLCGAVYAVAVKDPVYEAKSTYVLINPPAPPTAEEIARDPALGRVNADNPYTRFADQSVVVQVLTGALNSESARRALQDAGADSRYTVAPSAELGYSSPIVQITGVGATPRDAVHSAELVGEALKRELDLMQEERGVDPQYEIKTHQVEPPTGAELRASSQARTLVAVLALGAILLFVVVSAADALSALRRDRVEREAWSGPAGDGETWSAGPWPPGPEPGLDAENGIGSNGGPGHDGGAVDLFPDPDPEASAPSRGRSATEPSDREQHRSEG
jgi:hypothetical protein